MKNLMKLALAVVLTLAAGLASGCGAPAVLGARALLPLQSADGNRVWIYLDSNDDRADGVYRCVDQGETAVCTRAQLR